MENIDFIKLDEIDIPLQPNGFLNLESLLTRTGVFTYFEQSPDGTVKMIRQLREPDEVFAPESMETLMGLPVTENHPPQSELINPENAKDFIVGMSSDRPKRILAPVQGDKEEYIKQLVTFFDKGVIKKLVAGEKRELSLGYQCFLDESPGVWIDGTPYDFVQREIRYNHLSVVDRARGGASCRVLLDSDTTSFTVTTTDSDTTSFTVTTTDSAEPVTFSYKPTTICDGLSFRNDNIEEGRPMKKLVIDGKELEVTEAIYDAFTKMQTDSVSAQGVSAEKQKEFDKLSAQCDDYKSRLDVQNVDADKDKFKNAVSGRVNLERKALKVLGDDADVSTMSDSDIMKKVITTIRPECKLDGVSDEYMTARFDVCLEDWKPTSKGERVLGDSITTQNSDESPYKQNRDTAWEKTRTAWKKPVMG